MPQPPQNFSVRGFEVLFPSVGTLHCVVCLASHLCLPVYLHATVGLHGVPAVGLPVPVLQLLLCHESSPPQLPISDPLICPDECFLFNSLVVGLPYSLIFWQFGLFFVFKFFVVLLLFVCRGKVYLPMPPSWLEVSFFLM